MWLNDQMVGQGEVILREKVGGPVREDALATGAPGTNRRASSEALALVFFPSAASDLLAAVAA